ncbi:MAG: M15 family peptidase [Actinobacteria bacterium]|nr:M15 family peptidase [Actinomycetota bacterium]
MPKFGNESRKNLATAHPDLQLLFNAVVRDFDCSVLCGHRTQAEQDGAYRNKHSKLKFPNSKHNRQPSMAADVVPYPINWENMNRFYFFGGYVKKTAEMLGIKIRWGGDWDSDTLTDDQAFMDLPHFQLEKS